MSVRVTRAEARRRAEADKRDAPTPGHKYKGPVDIYDVDGNHIGWCTYPRLKSSYQARRDHESRNGRPRSYVLPDAAKQVNRDLGPITEEGTVEDLFPNLVTNVVFPLAKPGSDAIISGVPIEENSVGNEEFTREQEWRGKDWKACCGYGDHNGKPIRVVTGSEHMWPGNPAFYVFLINRKSERPLLKYGKTDYFRSRLMHYTATSEISVLHLRLWPLWTRKLKFTYDRDKFPRAILKENYISRHDKGTTLEQLLESQIKNRIRYDDQVTIQLLGGRQEVRDKLLRETGLAPSGKHGNFSEYMVYNRDQAIKLQQIVKKSEKVFETIGRPSLYDQKDDYELVRARLMSMVYDEAPASNDVQEDLEDYAAQGMLDENRVEDSRKKKIAKRRRREKPVEVIEGTPQVIARRNEGSTGRRIVAPARFRQ